MSKIRWVFGLGLAGALLVALGLYFAMASHTKLVKHISLRPSLIDSTAPAQQNDELKMAVGPIISPAASFAYYEDMFNYIGEKLGHRIRMVQRKTYAEINFLIKQRQIDAAFVCSRPYVEGRREGTMELLCVPVCYGQTTYRSYIIVHKDSSIQNIADLRGKTFAFSDPLSNSGMLIPTYILAKMGQTAQSYFERYIFTYSHDNSIRSVAEKFVDAAAVDSLIWEYMNMGKAEWTSQTRIIYKSSPCGIPPLVVSPQIDPKLKEQLCSAFLNMHNDARGSQILKRLLIERFTVIDDRAYDSIRQMEAYIKDFRH